MGIVSLMKKRTTRPDEHADHQMKQQVQIRLKRIEGQVRGIQKMVDEDRYCVDILIQISAIHESLRKVSEVLLRDHIGHCVSAAARSSDPSKAAKIYDELADLFNKYAR